MNAVEEQLALVNGPYGHRMTWVLTQADPAQIPVIGEIRYIVPFIKSEGAEHKVPLAPRQIIWTGNKWLEAP
jgi:hypothetical protein